MTAIAGLVRLVGVSIRAAPATNAAIALIVVIASFLATAAPGWFDQQSQGALAGLLASAPAGGSSLAFEETGTLGADRPDNANPIDAVDAEGRTLLGRIPASIAGGLGPPATLIDDQEYKAVGAPQPTTYITPRFEPGIGDAIRYTSGRPPTGTVDFEDNTDGSRGFGFLGTFEIALSRQTADALLLDVGQRLNLLDAGTAVYSHSSSMGAVVVGIFDVVDPSDPRWFGDHTLEVPAIRRITSELSDYHAIALLSPDAYGPLLSGYSTVFRYRWRFALDPGRPAAIGVDAFAVDLAALTRAFPFRAGAAAPGVAGLATGLPTLIDRYRAERAVASTAVSLASVGAMAAMAGSLVMLAGSLGRRRAGAVRLARARGADLGRLVGIGFVEAIVIVLPAAALGWLAASAWLAPASAPQPIGSAIVAVVALGLLRVASFRGARGPLALGRERADRTLEGRDRRLVLDGLVVVVAVVVGLGLQSRTATAPTAGLDPTRALAPVLLALAGAIVLLRVFNTLVAILARLARGSRGFVMLHAIRNLARGSRSHEVPLLVLLVAIAAGVFATGVSTTIARTQVLDAEIAVGADYRLESTDPGVLPTTLDLAALSEIGPIAIAGRDSGYLSRTGLPRLPIDVVALDVAAYRTVVAGEPIEPVLPAEFLAPPIAPDLTGNGARIPLVVPPTLASDSGIRAGQDLQLIIGGTPMPARVVAIADPVPALGLGRGVLAPLPVLRLAYPARTLLPTQIFLRAAASDRPRIDAVLARYGSGVTVRTLTGGVAALQAPPLVRTMTTAFIAGGVIAALFAIVVVGASVAQGLALRAPELAMLRAIGLSDRRAAGVVALEIGSTIVVATAGGLALGLAGVEIVLPTLGLAQLVGASAAAPPAVEPAGIALAVAGPALAALASLLVLGRSVGPSAAVTDWIRTAET